MLFSFSRIRDAAISKLPFLQGLSRRFHPPLSFFIPVKKPLKLKAKPFIYRDKRDKGG